MSDKAGHAQLLLIARKTRRILLANYMGLFAFCILSFCPACAASAESLSDAIAQAYQNNPALLAARAQQRALDETLIQARAALGPTANASGQINETQAWIAEPVSIFNPATTDYQHAFNPSGQVSISQPLYSGGQLTSAVSAAEADVLGGRQALRQQEAQTLSQVITAYADILLAKERLTIAEQNIAELMFETKEVDARVTLKILTLTDQAQAHARVLASEVSQQQARKLFADARARYLAVVGSEAGQLDPLPDLPGIPPDFATALESALKANPQLLQATYTELASRRRVVEAKASEGWQINLGLNVSQQPIEPYLPNQNALAASAALVISRPLFTSGIHASKVRQAEEADFRDDLKLADTRRQVVSAVTQGWDDIAADRRQIEAEQGQLDQEENAFNGERVEERYGVRPTIELLNAEQEFQATKETLAEIYHDEYLARVALLLNLGLLQAEFLTPGTQVYRPEKSFEQRSAYLSLMPWAKLVALIDGWGASGAVSPTLRSSAEVQQGGDVMPVTPYWSKMDIYLQQNPAY